MDLDKENLVHMNNHYQVVFIPKDDRDEAYDQEGNEVEGNFEVRHRRYDTVEYRSGNLPSALSVAEQFDNIITNNLYLTSAFADNEDELFVTVGKDEEGGLLN